MVYLGCCSICEEKGIKSNYVGETSRPLKARIKEHFKEIRNVNLEAPNTSAIGLHSWLAHGKQPNNQNWTFKVLNKCSNTQDRRTIEATLIKKLAPNLNRDRGVLTILYNNDIAEGFMTKIEEHPL